MNFIKKKSEYRKNGVHDATIAPFASLKKQAETLFRLIYCEKKNTVPAEKTS